MQNYLDLLQHILDNRTDKNDRTEPEQKCFRIPAALPSFQRFPSADHQKGTHKINYLRAALVPERDTNIKYLNDTEVTIWDEWADPTGELGPVYGKQWRSWKRRTDNQ